MIVSLKGHIYDNAKDQAPREKRIFVWISPKRAIDTALLSSQ